MFLSPCHSYAGPPLSVDEIVGKSEQASYYQGKDGRARVKMLIKDSQDRKRKRRFDILRRDDLTDDSAAAGSGDNQKYYLHISYPSDIKNTVFLVWKHTRQDDDRWLYLPALDLAKRIAAGDKRTSFLGSDFLYEDISGRALSADTHELVETTDNYYVVRNTPKQPETVEFSEYTMWIHKHTFLPVKAEYLDKQGKKYRVYDVLMVEEFQGYPTITKARMQNLVLGQETTLEIGNIQYDIGLPLEIFTERYLRNPPHELLR
jgi:hypothetical protein